MAFRYNEVGRKVHESPREAFKVLRDLFVEHDYDRRAVAGVLGVDESTLGRWLRRLAEGGHGDPRGGNRGPQGRPPKKKKTAKRQRGGTRSTEA